MRIGILGGTFDPIHMGHLVIAENARASLDLEKVIFVPSGEPWMKSGTKLSEARHRLKMVKLAIACKPMFRVSSREIDRPGPSYTIETLDALSIELGPHAELFFIVGLDSLKRFGEWKDPGRILRMARLVAVNRPGFKRPEDSYWEAFFNGAANRVVTVAGPSVDVSAREIRRRVSEGLTIRNQVCHEVGEYIAEHGLYRSRRVN